MRGKAHESELRAKVVAELVTGCPPTEVAERYDLPERTIFQWREQATTQYVRATGAYEARREDVISLVTDLVAESIRALTSQARVAGSDSWVKEQGASGLAEYRGVEFDRIIRLLAAFRPVEQPDANRALETTARPADASPVLSS